MSYTKIALYRRVKCHEKKWLSISTLVFALGINYSVAAAQVKYIMRKDFKSAYEINPNLNQLEEKFDLVFILLLDSTNKSMFFKHNPELERLCINYTSGMALNDETVGFNTQHSDISQVFGSTNRIMNCLSDENNSRQNSRKIN